METYLYLVVGLFISCVCFQYSIDRLFGRKLPWYGNIVGGVVTSVFIVPVAVVCFVLDIFGFQYPLFK